jgi:hypothetical protein
MMVNMKINFFSSLIKQTYNGLAFIGSVACILYIMRSLGFNNPTIYENYPASLVGAVTALIILEYYHARHDQE